MTLLTLLDLNGKLSYDTNVLNLQFTTSIGTLSWLLPQARSTALSTPPSCCTARTRCVSTASPASSRPLGTTVRGMLGGRWNVSCYILYIH